MYLCTVLLLEQNLLVRVDLGQGTASYCLLYADGTISSYDVEVEDGDDAILDLIKTLAWSEALCTLLVVQSGFVDQIRLDCLLAQVRPHYELIASMTSSLVQ